MSDIRSFAGLASFPRLRLTLLAGVSVLGMASAHQAEAAPVTVGTASNTDIGTAGTNNVVFAGGTLTMGGNATAGTGNTMSSSSTVNFTTASNLRLPDLAGTTGPVLTLNGVSGGMLTLSNGGSIQGGVAISGAQTLSLSGVLGGPVGLGASGSTLSLTGNASVAGLTGGASSTTAAAGSLIALGSNSLTVTNRQTMGGTLLQPGVIASTITNTGGGSLILASGSQLRLISNNDNNLVSSGASSSSAATPVVSVQSGAVLNLNGSGSIGKAAVNVSAGGTLSFGVAGSAATSAIGGLAGAGSVSSTVINNAVVINTSGQTYTGTLAGSSATSLTINGTGQANKTQSFVGGGNLTYSGKLIVSGGATLAVNSPTQISPAISGGGLTVTSGSTLSLASGAGATVSSALTGAGTVLLSSGTMTLSGAAVNNTLIFNLLSGASTTISTSAGTNTIGGLAGAGAVTVSGSGLTLSPSASGQNPSFGGTLTNSGSLTLANGTQTITSNLTGQTGATSVNTGATLILAGGGVGGAANVNGTLSMQGSSQVGGNVSVAAGGILTGTGTGTTGNGAVGTIAGSLINNGTVNAGIYGSPTNTPLTVNGNFTNGTGGILSFVVDKLTSSPMLSVGGTANLGGELYLNYAKVGTPSIGDFFPLIFASSGYQGDFSSFYASADGNANNSCTALRSYNPSYKDVWQCGSLYFAELINGGNLGIQVVDAASIPEPASMALLGAGLLGLGFAGRRRIKA